jgi:hypothetical protein
MLDRFLLWLGAGVVAASLSAALIAGGGVAAAETEDASDAGAASSESTNSNADKPNSDTKDEAADPDPKDDADDPDTADPAEPADDDIPATPEPTESAAPSELPEDPAVELPADESQKRASNKTASAKSEIDEAVVNRRDETGVTTEPDVTFEEPVVDAKSTQAVTVEPQTPSTPADPVVATVNAETKSVDAAVTELAFAAPEPAATAPAGPTLINVIGTLFFSVFDFVSKLFEGPPVVPAGANVRAGRSSLRIDCGDGYLTDADWYFPTEGEPDKLIYLQHGAFAQAGLYNVTAAELAERNNAIVVAPSITTNFFACDGCQLGGEQMHAAVAKLFLGDRAALLASAEAAGFTGTVLPQRFVIAGHSGGGQTAGGAAGYYAKFAPVERLHDMAGVLLLDTSHVGGAIERGVQKIRWTFPSTTFRRPRRR